MSPGNGNDLAMSGLDAALARMKLQTSVAKPATRMDGRTQMGCRGAGAFANRSAAAPIPDQKPTTPLPAAAPTPIRGGGTFSSRPVAALIPAQKPATPVPTGAPTPARHVTYLDFGAGSVISHLPAPQGAASRELKREAIAVKPELVKKPVIVAPKPIANVGTAPEREEVVEQLSTATIPKQIPIKVEMPSAPYRPPAHLIGLAAAAKRDWSAHNGLEESATTVKRAKFVKTAWQCRRWDQVGHQQEMCRYHHPRTQCTRYPNCSFGAEKCLYAHPFCSIYFCSCKPGMRSQQLNHWVKLEGRVELGRDETAPNWRPHASALAEMGSASTAAVPAVRGRPVKTGQQCFYWDDGQHSKAGCRFWHPIIPCKYYPRCMTGAKECLFGHPFCTNSGFCKCGDGGSASEQLNHATCTSHPAASMKKPEYSRDEHNEAFPGMCVG